jgi:hypothetical protein
VIHARESKSRPDEKWRKKGGILMNSPHAEGDKQCRSMKAFHANHVICILRNHLGEVIAGLLAFLGGGQLNTRENLIIVTHV